MMNQRATTNRQINVECSLIPLPFNARMRANAEIMFAWLRRAFATRR